MHCIRGRTGLGKGCGPSVDSSPNMAWIREGRRLWYSNLVSHWIKTMKPILILASWPIVCVCVYERERERLGDSPLNCSLP